MNRTLTNLIAFTIGAAIGSVVTWKLVKTKYEKIADHEIEEMREYYRNREIEKGKSDINRVEHALNEVKENAEKATEEYKKIANMYTNQQLVKPETRLEEEEEDEDMPKPYIITPEEFSDSEYDVETLTYYADGVIEDGFNEVWSKEEVEANIGTEFQEHYGEYEQDTVYVRNEYKETDYEILRDERNYYQEK